MCNTLVFLQILYEPAVANSLPQCCRDLYSVFYVGCGTQTRPWSNLPPERRGVTTFSNKQVHNARTGVNISSSNIIIFFGDLISQFV